MCCGYFSLSSTPSVICCNCRGDAKHSLKSPCYSHRRVKHCAPIQNLYLDNISIKTYSLPLLTKRNNNCYDTILTSSSCQIPDCEIYIKQLYWFWCLLWICGFDRSWGQKIPSVNRSLGPSAIKSLFKLPLLVICMYTLWYLVFSLYFSSSPLGSSEPLPHSL